MQSSPIDHKFRLNRALRAHLSTEGTIAPCPARRHRGGGHNAGGHSGTHILNVGDLALNRDIKRVLEVANRCANKNTESPRRNATDIDAIGRRQGKPTTHRTARPTT